MAKQNSDGHDDDQGIEQAVGQGGQVVGQGVDQAAGRSGQVVRRSGQSGQGGEQGGRGGEQDGAPTAAPGTVRGAGALAALEGVIGVVVAIVLVVRGLSGVDQSKVSAYGTAAWFLILGGAVLAAGIGLFVGRRWGRAIAVIAQVLLLPVSWYMLEGGQLLLGIPLGVIALAGLGLLFAPPSSRWMAQGYDSSIGSAG